jgi:hypothetical protein
MAGVYQYGDEWRVVLAGAGDLGVFPSGQMASAVYCKHALPNNWPVSQEEHDSLWENTHDCEAKRRWLKAKELEEGWSKEN